MDRKDDVLCKLTSGEIKYLSIKDETESTSILNDVGTIRTTTKIEVQVAGQWKSLNCITVGVWIFDGSSLKLHFYRSRLSLA
jgi:hypothetical protein